MKTYIVVYEINTIASGRKLGEDDRKLVEIKMCNCYHLADLFNSLNEQLEGYRKYFFPEVISIREV